MSNAVQILMVEDNPADAVITYELLMDAKVPVVITVAKDGRKALDILSKEMVFGGPLHDLIILDLNMPRINGFEVLREIRSSPALHDLPVVVMTGSSNKEDEIKARNLGATDYKVKPATIGEMDSTIQWLNELLAPLYGIKAKIERNPNGAVLSADPIKIPMIDNKMQQHRLVGFDGFGPSMGIAGQNDDGRFSY